jgi:hypothetical protein
MDAVGFAASISAPPGVILNPASLPKSRGHRRTVVFELLRAVVDRDPRALADVFVVAAFVGILKAAPATHVVCQDALEVSAPGFDFLNHTAEAIPTTHIQTAFARVLEHTNQRHLPARRILLDPVELVLGRILLMFGGHAHVCRRRNGSGIVRAERELMLPAHRSLNPGEISRVGDSGARGRVRRKGKALREWHIR